MVLFVIGVIMAFMNGGGLPPDAREGGGADSIRSIVCSTAYGGRPCTIHKDSTSAAVGGWDLWWGSEVTEAGNRNGRRLWVRRAALTEKPKGLVTPLDIIIAGQPMRRSQLRALLETPGQPGRRVDVAGVVIAANGDPHALARALSGELVGHEPDVVAALFGPRVIGEAGARVFEFVARTQHGGIRAVRVGLDGEGDLGLTSEPLVPPRGPRRLPRRPESKPPPRPEETEPAAPPDVDPDELRELMEFFPARPAPSREQ